LNGGDSYFEPVPSSAVFICENFKYDGLCPAPRRSNRLSQQHAAALRVKDAITAKLEDENAALKLQLVEMTSSHAAALRKLEAQQEETVTDFKAEVAALKAQAASTLAEIHTAVTTGAMEIFPIRPSDSRQVGERRAGGIPPPPPPQFDRAWCAAVCAGGWEADVDVFADCGNVWRLAVV
jgi:hypothetical protein